MTPLRRLLGAAGIALTAATAAPVPAALAAPPAGAPTEAAQPVAAPTAVTRIEARSADFLAVGLLQGDRMSIRLSRVADNAPVPDAVLTVLLRGVVHPTMAQADGSYTLETKDLTIPGQAALELQISQGALHARLPASLLVADGEPKPADANGARQLGWWVLNFAVCIGFLLLLSRRRKIAAARDAARED